MRWLLAQTVLHLAFLVSGGLLSSNEAYSRTSQKLSTVNAVEMDVYSSHRIDRSHQQASDAPRIQARTDEIPQGIESRTRLINLKIASERLRPRTLADINRIIAIQRQTWPATPNGMSVMTLFDLEILSVPNLHLNSVVCIGLGSLKNSRTYMQSSEKLAALEIMIAILRRRFNIDNRSVYFSDPTLTAIDRRILSGRGYSLVEFSEVRRLISSSTFLFVPDTTVNTIMELTQVSTPPSVFFGDSVHHLIQMIRDDPRRNPNLAGLSDNTLRSMQDEFIATFGRYYLFGQIMFPLQKDELFTGLGENNDVYYPDPNLPSAPPASSLAGQASSSRVEIGSFSIGAGSPFRAGEASSSRDGAASSSRGGEASSPRGGAAPSSRAGAAPSPTAGEASAPMDGEASAPMAGEASAPMAEEADFPRAGQPSSHGPGEASTSH
ncbi:hypothetical protein MMC11_006207 [Xylographa trunciseda]|nr:hypothetical protein [Xylographa trunciseda]